MALFYGLAGAAGALLVGGFFSYLRHAPSRKEVGEMIEKSIHTLSQNIDESLKQSKINTSMIQMIQASVQETNHQMGILKVDFKYLAEDVREMREEEKEEKRLAENGLKKKLK